MQPRDQTSEDRPSFYLWESRGEFGQLMGLQMVGKAELKDLKKKFIPSNTDPSAHH